MVGKNIAKKGKTTKEKKVIVPLDYWG